MSANSIADTELWLVHVPHGFDVSALNNLNTSIFGLDGNTQTLKVKTDQEKTFYSVSASREETGYKKTFAMVTGAGGQMSLGGELLNTLTVTQTAAPATESIDSVDSAFPTPAPAPASRVCMPTGLRQRFTLFGADAPCPSVSRKKKKKKERESKGEESLEEEVCKDEDMKKSNKKRKEENMNHGEEVPEIKKSEEEVEVHQGTKKNSKKRKRDENHNHREEEHDVKREEEVQDTKKSSKRRKREENVNHHEEEEEREAKREEEVSQDMRKSSKKRKREESPDRCEEEPEKKKKKNKHRHSESMDLHNGDTGNTVASPTKHKRRQSEETIQDWSVNNDLFVIDTIGDQRLGKDDVSASNKKHKKSKKHKKHRQAM